MLDFPKWKVWLVIAFTVTGMIFALPSLLPQSAVQYLPQKLQDTRINLGLDLAGGSELLLEATTDDVAKIRMERMEEAVRTDLRRVDPRIEVGDISTSGGILSFMLRNTADVDKAITSSIFATKESVEAFMKDPKAS